MNMWGRLIGRKPAAETVERWVVVDTETTGLDPANDSLLAIGAVAVTGERIDIEDSFEVTVQQQSIRSGPDILIHGIGVGSQREGVPLADAVRAFLGFLGESPMVGFHAGFDQAVLGRAFGLAGAKPPSSLWLDVADLAPALLPGHARTCQALDEWLAACAIRCDNRHNAAVDAFATAELLAYLLPAARRQGTTGYGALRKLARSAKWLARGGQ